MRLDEYEKRFEFILEMDSKKSEKNLLLSGLMTDLERNFHVPMMKNEAWNMKTQKFMLCIEKLLIVVFFKKIYQN